MELRKLMQAAFVAGFAFVVLVGGSLLWAPGILWLGVLGSVSVGFLAYQFGDVLRAIPVAFQTTVDAGRNTRIFLKKEISAFRAWFRKPHPFVYDTVASGIVLATLALFFFVPGIPNPESHYALRITALFFIASVICWFCSVIIFAIFADIGHAALHKQQPYVLFQDFVLADGEYGYGQLAGWTLLGILYFCFRDIPVGGWKLIRIVASYRRFMVMISGLIGGGIATEGFVLTGPVSPTLFEYSMVPLVGGVIASAIVAGLYALIMRSEPALGENSANA